MSFFRVLYRPLLGLFEWSRVRGFTRVVTVVVDPGEVEIIDM